MTRYACGHDPCACPADRAGLLLTALAAAHLAGCDAPHEKTSTPAGGGDVWFVDATKQVGLDFVHENGRSGHFYMPEIMGAGVALVDADDDGDLDVYLVQGGSLENGKPASTDRLFRNDLPVAPESGIKSTGPLSFTDITHEAGIPPGGYGMGVATGDVDSDGHADLYVTNFGPNRLLRNRGDGSFEDVTVAAGVSDILWSVPATFFDMDGDGDHDLFVGNYVEFRLANHKDCFSATGLPDYCSPHSYNAVPDRLFRNRGGGSFEEVGAATALRNERGKALGVVSSDFDADGRVDLYVANDGMANQLWFNRGAGLFEDAALFAGCALNFEGLPEASMGVDAADVDGDGDEDLFVTHLRGETNTLYLNRGDATFEDRTIRMGLAGPSIPSTGFGTAWIDVDNDGRLDIFAVNGGVTAEEHLVQAGDPFPFHQRNQLFMNRSDADSIRFEEAPAEGPFAVSEVSRGAAFGDLDNDGDVDVVVSNNAGPARVLLNTRGQDANWLGLRLRTGPGGSDALDATAEIRDASGRRILRRVRTAGSYASASDPRLLFGLGNSTMSEVQDIVVHWTEGSSERFGPLQTRRYHSLERGRGQAASAAQ